MGQNELRPLLEEVEIGGGQREEPASQLKAKSGGLPPVEWTGTDSKLMPETAWSAATQTPLKYGQWTWRLLLLRRKMLLLLALALLLFYLHFTLQEDGDFGVDLTSFVPVQHQSNVLGRAVHLTEPMSVTMVDDELNEPDDDNNSTILHTKGYLVWNDHCKIADLDPYKHEVMRHFSRSKYKACSSQEPLTKLSFNQTAKRYVLSINGPALASYHIGSSLSCCYMGVERINETKVDYTECLHLKKSVQLSNSTDSVVVKCRTGNKQIYINAHPTVAERWAVRRRLKKWAEVDERRGQHRAPSVLMIGIDSVSRVNLIRAMPKTAQYLYDNEWFELAGYNKIEDNTFPNIMALMTGYNLSSAISRCSPYQEGGLESCEFIWQLYREHGYVTAYGEDAVTINTFNYLKKGFKEPPVDYFMRPYLTAAEKLLKMTIVSGLPQCLGYKHEAEHVYDYALEFARRFGNDSFFGFFWTNTHSHNDISATSSMDERMRGYLERLVEQGTANNTIMVFFSDHGLRFGPTRATWSGHLEERLPFIFIWLPPYLRKAHPEMVSALRLNRNRLTNPYDLHLTLKHILTLSGRASSLQALGPARDCPQCQSLLLPVSENRSCSDVAIDDHWCTCWPYEQIYKDSKTVHQLAKYVVQHINTFVTEFRNGSFAKLCQPLSYMSVKAAFRAIPNVGDGAHARNYRLLFYTKPNKALYEATVRHDELSNDMQVSGSVSRLNMYNGEADCMKDFAAKKYCYCRSKSG